MTAPRSRSKAAKATPAKAKARRAKPKRAPKRPPKRTGAQRAQAEANLAKLTRISQAEREAAQTRFLAALATEPTRTVASIARELGRTFDTVQRWLKEPGFAAAYRRVIRTAQEVAPPTAPDFIDFRAEYLNVPTRNASTGRTLMTGITYPFMEPALRALDDPANDRVLIIWPVRHGKSTILEQLCVYLYCRSPSSRVIYLSPSLGHAKERAYNVKRMLQDDVMYPELHERWGLWIGKPEDKRRLPWTQTSFYTRARNDPERAPSFAAYGVDADVYGARADAIIIDDPDNPGLGEDMRAKRLWNIDGAISSRLNEGGKVVGIMTRCGYRDIAASLMAQAGWKVFFARALADDGRPLCPEMYSLEELTAARDRNELAFQLLYQNNPEPPEGSSLFPPELTKIAEGDYDIGEAPDDWQRVMMLDPSATGTAAVLVLAHDGSGQMRVIDCMARHNPGYDGVFEMLQLGVRHRPRALIVEESGATFLTDYPAIQRFVYEEGLQLVRFRTGAQKNDPRVGMGLVAERIRTGRLTYAWGTDEARRVMGPLVAELNSWRPTSRTARGNKRWNESKADHHWDRTMALWFGVNWVFHRENTQNAPKVAGFVDPLFARRPFARAGGR